MYKILLVCLGNLCRSPMAEVLFKRMLKEEGLDKKVLIESAATNSQSEGDPAESRTLECVKKHGLDLDEHRTRPLRVSDFANFDLVLAMDDKSLKSLAAMRPKADAKYKAKVMKLLEFSPEYIELYGNADVPDPYYECTFDHTFSVLETAGKGLINHLKTEVVQ